MTTIRISRLPEIKNDRVSADDFVILNDGDLVTSKIAFSEFCIGIGAQDIEYTGDILYTGEVTFEGPVTGDFYNKDQTYSKTEINQLISNLEDYNVIQDLRVSSLIALSGLPELSTDLGTFPLLSTCIDGGEAAVLDNLTVKEAMTTLRLYTKENRCYITTLQAEIIVLRGEVEDLDDRVTIIEGQIDLNGGPGDPTDPTPPNGILPWLQWLTIKVGEHEILLNEHTNKLNEHEYRIEQLEERVDKLEVRAEKNDRENANLIILSGRPADSQNLGTFTYNIVTHDANNATFRSQSLDNTTVKDAFQEVLSEVRSRAPWENPIFVGKIIGSKDASVIPFFHPVVNSLNSVTGADNTADSVEGAFAYTKSGGYGLENKSEPRAWVKGPDTGGFDWLQILTSGNYWDIVEALNLRHFANDGDARGDANPIGDGFVYVQTDPSGPPMLKVLGVNTADNPRP